MSEKYNDFESALKHLKLTVEDFENNKNLTLDELIENYESGMNAYEYCINKLNEAEKKIQIIDNKINE